MLNNLGSLRRSPALLDFSASRIIASWRIPSSLDLDATLPRHIHIIRAGSLALLIGPVTSFSTIGLSTLVADVFDPDADGVLACG